MGMKKFISLPYFIFSFIILAALMVSSALFELHQSKKELLELMQENAHAIIDGAVYGSIYNIRSGRLLEDEVVNRLFDNATLIDKLQRRRMVDKKMLLEIMDDNDLIQVAILDKNLRPRVFVNRNNPNGKIVLPDKKSFLSQDNRRVEKIVVHQSGDLKIFSALYELDDGGFIVVSLDGKILLDFRKKAGIGSLISGIAENRNIIYLAVQDENGILAAKNVDSLSRISDDSKLLHLLQSDTSLTREVLFRGQNILEIAQAFQLSDENRALFRMGLSLEPLENINIRIIRRILIITAILIVLGLLLFTILNFRQQYDLVNKQYGMVQTHFSKVVDSINEGIVTLDEENLIKSINPAGEEILNVRGKRYLGQPFENIPVDWNVVLKPGETERYFNIGKLRKYLYVNIAPLGGGENQEKGKLIIIRDYTEKKSLGEQLRQKERLTAMGQLASGVAHEVRNPLNAISTIIQQFDMDFEPVENGEEFHSLARLVIREVKRINQIITRFVNFARPPKLNLGPCKIENLLEEMVELAKNSAGGKNIQFESEIKEKAEVRWDCDQIRQVLINLFKNAIDAIKDEGLIKILVSPFEENIQITITDNGSGISEEHLNKIFNLYFTTKPEGTGFGLSDVHRIISQHGGNIEVNSTNGKGSEFIISIPREVNYV